MLEKSASGYGRRPTRAEIMDLFRACRAKVGKTPGRDTFFKLAGIKEADVLYHWPRYSSLVTEAGAQPNEFMNTLSDEEVFRDYARVCLHLRKIPTRDELRIAERELGTRTSRVYKRFGNIVEFDARFRSWLENNTAELRTILELPGWRASVVPRPQDIEEIIASVAVPGLHPFLPQILQYYDTLARGERPPFENSPEHVNTLFERRTSDAFRCLGFETSPLGQGSGRNADVLAVARRERFAVIIDAKVRASGYVLGTEDRKFLEYARTHGADLLGDGLERIYFVVIASSFKDSDLPKLTSALADSPLRSVSLITAAAMMRIVETSIRERAAFKLADLERHLFGNKIIAE